MKATIKIFIISIVCVSLNSCGDKPEQTTNKTKTGSIVTSKTHDLLNEEAITNLENLNSILSQIKDQKSATAAAPKLTQIGAKFNMLKTDLARLGPPNEQQAGQLKQKYSSRMLEINAKIDATMKILQVSSPEAFATVGKIMKSIMP